MDKCFSCKYGQVHAWPNKPASSLFCYRDGLKGATLEEREQATNNPCDEYCIDKNTVIRDIRHELGNIEYETRHLPARIATIKALLKKVEKDGS